MLLVSQRACSTSIGADEVANYDVVHRTCVGYIDAYTPALVTVPTDEIALPKRPAAARPFSADDVMGGSTTDVYTMLRKTQDLQAFDGVPVRDDD